MKVFEQSNAQNSNLEKISGIVERVTFHSPETGWSVLKVAPFRDHGNLTTVLVHQAKVFAGSSMEFWGTWSRHPKHGDQFKSEKCNEMKPSTSAAMEKYLGSGLIKGVGPVIAKRIVHHFNDRTLHVFEENLNELLSVPGIATRKLEDIKISWNEHKAIRDVMIFLQGYGISTLYAVKIFKAYGSKSIEKVQSDPYCLARDIYGIGFFSADKIALALGFEKEGLKRMEAGIKHVLASSREEGHCFLMHAQISEKAHEVLQLENTEIFAKKLNDCLALLLKKNEIKLREDLGAFYSRTLYFEEEYVSAWMKSQLQRVEISVDKNRVEKWINAFCNKQNISLSSEQQMAVIGITSSPFSILTGGPGCGKTTTTRVLTKLLLAMGRKVILAAPTGRASQRMSEVIGEEAKTIHRILEWIPQKGSFLKGEESPLDLDFLILDECSMLDISIAASVLKAVPKSAQVLFIGDPDQLPSVGPGQVLRDLLGAPKVPRFALTQIFRQAASSQIITFAHEINKGIVPQIPSPLADTKLWAKESMAPANCLFVDAQEATQDQIKVIQRAKAVLAKVVLGGETQTIQRGDEKIEQISFSEKLLIQEYESKEESQKPDLSIPARYMSLDLEKLAQSQKGSEDLKSLLSQIHPWSSLHFGLTATEVLLHIYGKTIPKALKGEIQVLTPQQRGSLGAVNLNKLLQERVNPPREGTRQWVAGDRILREGDRVIQTRNNYDLGVFNGDIGILKKVDFEEQCCFVEFEKSKDGIRYAFTDLTELSLAYAITVHKSQGSEFDVVIIPVASQHYKMLFRNLIYTGLTRAKKLCVFVGSRKALALAVKHVENQLRQTALKQLLQ